MNLLTCHSFTNKIKYIVTLKFPKIMLEYYFSKGFGDLEYNSNDFEENSEFSKTNNPCRRNT